MNSYTKSDLRSLELHKKIVEKLQQTPALWDIVFENIDLLKKNNSTLSTAYKEWEEILSTKLKVEICNLLSETTENGQRLRSSSSFSRILSEEERLEVFSSFSKFRRSA